MALQLILESALVQEIQMLGVVNEGFAHGAGKKLEDLEASCKEANSLRDDLNVMQKSTLGLACCRLALSQPIPPAEHLILQRKFHQQVRELLDFVESKEKLGIDQDGVVVTTTTTTAFQVASGGLSEVQVPGYTATMEQEFRALEAESRQLAEQMRQRQARKASAKARKNHKEDKIKARVEREKRKGASSDDAADEGRKEELNRAKKQRKKATKEKFTVASGREFYAQETTQIQVATIKTAIRQANNLAELRAKLTEICGSGHNIELISHHPETNAPLGLWSVRVQDRLRITFKILNMNPLRVSQVTFSDHYKNL